MGSFPSPTSRSPGAARWNAPRSQDLPAIHDASRPHGDTAGSVAQSSGSSERASSVVGTPWMWATGASISATAARGRSPSLRAADARREAAARGTPETRRFPTELRATMTPTRRRALRQSVVMRGTDQLLRPLRMLAHRGDARGSSSALALASLSESSLTTAASTAVRAPAPCAASSVARRAALAHKRAGRCSVLVVDTNAEPLSASAQYRAHSTSAPGELLGQEARAKRDLLDAEVRDRVAPLPSPLRARSRVAALSCAKSTGAASAESGDRNSASSRPSSRGSRGSCGSLGSDASTTSDWERAMGQRVAPPESSPCLRAAHFAVRRALDARRAAGAAAAEAAAVVGAAMARTAHLRNKSTVAVRGIVLTNPSVGVATDGGWHDDGASVGSSGTSMSLKLALRIAATSSANLPLS